MSILMTEADPCFVFHIVRVIETTRACRFRPEHKMESFGCPFDPAFGLQGEQ